MSTSARILSVLLLFAAGCSRPAPVAIRVLSYNIHHGEGTDGKLDLERIAGVIRASGADLVAFQEVDRGVERTARVDQPGRLGELTGMQPIFEKNIPYQGGEYGNAILSRLPVESHQNHYLPQSRPGEQRGLLEARVRVAGRSLLFFATHFDYHSDDGERMASAAMVRRMVNERPGQPIILAGDINATPDNRVLAELYDFLLETCPADTNALTFPAGKPDRRIDYILYTPGTGLQPVDYRVLDEPVASDHRPVLVTFLVQQEASMLRSE